MIENFASCVKSTVSIEDERCERESCVQMRRKWHSLFEQCGGMEMNEDRYTIVGEIARLKRKVVILQKSKEVLTEELALTKEDLENQIGRVRKLEAQRQAESQQNKQLPVQNGSNSNLSIILRQKQEQIDLLSKQLRSKQRELQYLKFDKKELKDVIEDKSSILQRVQESSKAQLCFYRKQIQQMQTELANKGIDMIEVKKFYEDVMSREQRKWQLVIKRNNQKILTLEKEITGWKEKQDNLTKTFNNFREQKMESDQLLQIEREKTKWLTQLIQQAKIDFIHSELKKQQLRDQNLKQKAKKKYKQFSNHSKSYRSVSQISTALPSAKAQTKLSANISIAPFQFTPYGKEISSDESQFAEINLSNNP